jgi:methylglutaconyl-CoA hydratase
VFGGGVGLVACCDIAFAAHDATFSLSETKLGLIPATIGPYVVEAIGARAARRYFLSAERFTAAEACRIGLVHELYPVDELDARINELLGALLVAGPRAQGEAKALIRAVAGRPIDDTLIADTAERIARVRGSLEGREGVAAFLEKRSPAWVPPALR